MKKTIFLSMLFFSLYSCTDKVPERSANCNASLSAETLASRITISQGAFGIITFTEGNCMPGYGASSRCVTCPVSRKVRFYEYTKYQDATLDGNILNGFYASLNARLVAETTSDMDGFFQLNLPPGTYSMVVVEDGRLYANSYDGLGGINPVIVENGTKKADLGITYKAVF